jgi:hypothetical protein
LRRLAIDRSPKPISNGGFDDAIHIKQEENMSNLNERAMLVTLRISSWAGMMHDKEVTEDVNESYKAAKEAGRYNKRLVASSFLKGVAQAHSKARKTHKVLTLPWEYDGTGILASAGYLNYVALMKDCRRQAETQVKQFLTMRDDYIKDGAVRLGKMFDAEDYPSNEEVEAKFGFDVEISAVPDAGDFRVALGDETVKAVVKGIEKRTNDRLQNAMDDVFRRIEELVKHMVDKLRAYEPKAGGRQETIIRDSIVQNIFELTRVLPILNITNDPRITELEKRLTADLVASPVMLRTDAKLRATTISKADAILRKVQSYMK